MLLNSRQIKFLKNYRNVKVKSSANREYRDENVFLKGDRALSKLSTLLISNKKVFSHFFKSRSSDIVLLKLGNLNQNAKRYEAHNTEREARIENVRAKRADFFINDLVFITMKKIKLKNSFFISAKHFWKWTKGHFLKTWFSSNKKELSYWTGLSYMNIYFTCKYFRRLVLYTLKTGGPFVEVEHFVSPKNNKKILLFTHKFSIR